jgi:hypothetical protein
MGLEEQSMLWHCGRRLDRDAARRAERSTGHQGRSARLVLGAVLVALVGACGGTASSPNREAAASPESPEVKAALDGIRGAQVEQHMRVLADDKLEGRAPGTEGYDGALRYVETTVRSLGLAPAGEAGGFRQRVPLRNSVVVEESSFVKVTSAAGTRTLVYGTDYMLGADHLREQVGVDDAAVVFVGYGVSAPVLGYDDYGTGVGVEGKVVAYLSGAPATLPSNERAYYS